MLCEYCGEYESKRLTGQCERCTDRARLEQLNLWGTTAEYEAEKRRYVEEWGEPAHD